MNILIIFPVFGLISIVLSIPAKDVQQNQDSTDNVQAKRDLSLSYAATDIGSKEGTRVKTITVIKNIAGKKDKPLKIDAKLHKNDDWGSHFRDNFDAYGKIPDVPDIDELFDFVNKKDEKKPKDSDDSGKKEDEAKKEESGEDESEEDANNAETTIAPAPVEEVVNEEKVEKILGEAELIQPAGKQGKVKSQSLDLGKYRVKESIDEDYQPGQRNTAVKGKTEKYIQSASVPYYYPQPNPSYPGNPNVFQSPQKNRGSVSVSTSSGKKFDVPVSNTTDSTPYIAPSFRRTQQNSPSGQQVVTSSQRPYIAPNVRKNYEVQLSNSNSSDCGSNNSTNSSQLSNFFNYQEVPPTFRATRFGPYKPSLPRSRGLRY